jgi:antitoxin component YwqK of YwqJK toxin-antitoxin module
MLFRNATFVELALFFLIIQCSGQIQSIPMHYDTILHEYSISEYYPNGQLKLSGKRLEVPFDDKWNVLIDVGWWEKNYRNGMQKHLVCFDSSGVKTGRETFFYRNGSIRREINWSHVTSDSSIAPNTAYFVTDYYRNGVVKREGMCIDKSGYYFKRDRQGEWIFYRKSGKARSVKHFSPKNLKTNSDLS